MTDATARLAAALADRYRIELLGPGLRAGAARVLDVDQLPATGIEAARKVRDPARESSNAFDCAARESRG
jgi:hypothetical protein